MYSKYFTISDIKDGTSTIYKINYENEEDLLKKIVFITLAPEINKSTTLSVSKLSENAYWIYVTSKTIIRIDKVDGRKVAKRPEYKYSSSCEDIDMQYNKVSKQYENLHFKFVKITK